MTTTINQHDGITNISINGRLDSVTAPQFDSEVAHICSPDSHGIYQQCRTPLFHHTA